MKFALIVLTVLLVTGCSKIDQDTKVDPEQPQAKEQVTDRPSIAEAVDAAIRAHPNSTQVCYDTGVNGFLIHYPEQEANAVKDNQFHGWYFLKFDKIWRSENGTWFMRNEAATDYVEVYPNIKDLTCKNT